MYGFAMSLALRDSKEMRKIKYYVHYIMISKFVYTVSVLVFVICWRFRTNPQNQMEAIIHDNPIEMVASDATLASRSFNNQQQTLQPNFLVWMNFNRQ